jgi:hypothetical protein
MDATFIMSALQPRNKSPSNILGGRNHLKVVWIAADGIPAQVIKYQVLWDLTPGDVLKDETMSTGELGFEHDLPVAASGN